MFRWITVLQLPAIWPRQCLRICAGPRGGQPCGTPQKGYLEGLEASPTSQSDGFESAGILLALPCPDPFSRASWRIRLPCCLQTPPFHRNWAAFAGSLARSRVRSMGNSAARIPSAVTYHVGNPAMALGVAVFACWAADPGAKF